MTTYRNALDAARAAVDEFSASVDNLNTAAEACGQGNPAVPLIIQDWGSDLKDAR